MGVKLAATALVALAFAGTAAAGIDSASRYVYNHRKASGGFAEPGGSPTPGLTAWAVLGLRAAGHCSARSGRYLRRHPADSATDLELQILAFDALRTQSLGACQFDIDLSRRVRRLQGLRHDGGRIGPTVNSTIWGILALRATGRPAGHRTVRYLRHRQRPSGGWPWYPGGQADSNDTAAAIQALRSVGIRPHARVVNRGVRYLRRLQNGDGGFELTPGRGSDAQSTAWAIQALVAAKRKPGAEAWRYVHRMQRDNGSFRYSAQYVTTPVWVTSQALGALAREPFPLK